MPTLTISLPDSLKAFISLLRDAQAKEEEARLESLLLEGLASNRLPLDTDVLKRIEARTVQIPDKYKDRQRP